MCRKKYLPALRWLKQASKLAAKGSKDAEIVTAKVAAFFEVVEAASTAVHPAVSKVITETKALLTC